MNSKDSTANLETNEELSLYTHKFSQSYNPSTKAKVNENKKKLKKLN